MSYAGAASSAVAAAAGAAARSSAASQAAMSAAALVSFDISSLHAVYEVKRSYIVVAGSGEVQVWREFVTVQENETGFLGSVKVVNKTRSLYDPLPDAIQSMCPEGCVFLAFTLDWYHEQVRIYYGKLPCSTQTPNDTENSETS